MFVVLYKYNTHIIACLWFYIKYNTHIICMLAVLFQCPPETESTKAGFRLALIGSLNFGKYLSNKVTRVLTNTADPF